MKARRTDCRQCQQRAQVRGRSPAQAQGNSRRRSGGETPVQAEGGASVHRGTAVGRPRRGARGSGGSPSPARIRRGGGSTRAVPTSLLSATGTHLNIRREVSPTVTHFFSLRGHSRYRRPRGSGARATLATSPARPPTKLRLAQGNANPERRLPRPFTPHTML